MLLIEPDGSVPLPYHKQLPIPFGEYIPYGGIFPWLHYVNNNKRAIDSGLEAKVFEIQHPTLESPARVSPLICYEDLFPALSIGAVNAGAEALVSVSDDSWLLEMNEPLLWQQSYAGFVSRCRD